MTDFATLSIIIRLIFGLVTLVGYGYLSFRMVKEVLKPYDGLTRLRWRILILVTMVILTLIPPLIYQGLRLYGFESEILRNIITIVTSINSTSALVMLFSVLTYRNND